VSTRDGLSRTGRVLAVVAVVALLLGVVAVLAPGVVPSPVESALTTLPPAVVLSLLAFAAILLLLVRSRRSRSRGVEPLVGESEATQRAPRLGSSFDEALDAATDLEATRKRRLVDREQVEETVRAAAVEAYAVERGVDRETARETVVAGGWTNDRRASALVGGPDAPTPSWGQWLLDLLRSESAYHRRVRHALAETERALLADDDRDEDHDDAGDDDAAGSAANGGASA
jgi:hypothetical protein